MTKKFKDKGYDPEAFTFYNYAAIQIWAQAVEKAKSTDMAAVSATLKSGKFPSVLGTVSFDKKGDISNPGFVMYYFNKGKRYYLE